MSSGLVGWTRSAPSKPLLVPSFVAGEAKLRPVGQTLAIIRHAPGPRLLPFRLLLSTFLSAVEAAGVRAPDPFDVAGFAEAGVGQSFFVHGVLVLSDLSLLVMVWADPAILRIGLGCAADLFAAGEVVVTGVAVACRRGRDLLADYARAAIFASVKLSENASVTAQFARSGHASHARLAAHIWIRALVKLATRAFVPRLLFAVA